MYGCTRARQHAADGGAVLCLYCCFYFLPLLSLQCMRALSLCCSLWDAERTEPEPDIKKLYCTRMCLWVQRLQANAARVHAPVYSCAMQQHV